MMRVFWVVAPSATVTTPLVAAPRRASDSIRWRPGADAPGDTRRPRGGGHVARDVAGAAGPEVLVDDVHDRHGCLRRDALDPAPDELVEHQIAHDQDPHATQAARQPRQPLAAHATH